MALRRVAVKEFQLGNSAYAGAQVSLYGIDTTTRERTTTLITLYDAQSGSGLLANPQTLDADGKFVIPVYVDEAYQAVVSGNTIGSHATGIVDVIGSARGDWAPNTAYAAGDTVSDGANGASTGNIYEALASHTSGAIWATDLATYWNLWVDVSAIQGSADDAAASAAAAAASETAAANSASTALTQANAAQTAATNASTSAAAAATSASSAATSATNASAYSGAANSSATNATVQAANAATSATNAANSATAAASSATAAAASETAAASSATAAASSATSAASSATSASSSATTATTQATTATTQASNAATSATNAATSASSASTSATNAANSATAAASSATAAAASVGSVKVTAADTTATVLDSALTVTAPLVKTVGSPGGNETLGLSISAATTSTAGTMSAADKTKLDGADIQGKKTILVLGTAFEPGSGPDTSVNDRVRTLNFDAAAVEEASILLSLPKSVQAGTFTADILFRNAAASNNVVWQIDAVAVRDGVAMSTAFGTGVTVTKAVSGSTGRMNVASVGAVTPGNTWAADDMLLVRIQRLATNGSDTNTGDAQLVAVKFYFTTNAGNDA